MTPTIKTMRITQGICTRSYIQGDDILDPEGPEKYMHVEREQYKHDLWKEESEPWRD